MTVSAYKWLEFMHNIITNSSDTFTNLQIFRTNICYESLSTGKLRMKNSFEPTTICFLFQLLKLNKIREANWRKYLMNLILEKGDQKDQKYAKIQIHVVFERPLRKRNHYSTRQSQLVRFLLSTMYNFFMQSTGS